MLPLIAVTNGLQFREYHGPGGQSDTSTDDPPY